ncbi:unnamed protein product [Vitrella brassicaformis CCMP3155]|uniref:SbsA Ig-like domain-containing protein n=1 Tax=Vitrella brassicaformis (strain CCMP3155) TaxID=1169540 RepID=A0A0G4FTA6_VITBC|nr:unnamed protein product [Vitrella brassicaformis CCMP3155]|eukprot:CEM17993.1 unnamed protein product [Vitrella brassicaformis CCMP3155]
MTITIHATDRKEDRLPTETVTITGNGFIKRTGGSSDVLYKFENPNEYHEGITVRDNTQRCADVCGNGLVMPGIEECDDVGTPTSTATPASGDGCSASCTIEEGWECNNQKTYGYEGEGPSVCTARPMIPTLSTETLSIRILPFAVSIALSEPAKSGSFEAADIILSGAAEASITSLQTVSNQRFTANVQPTSGGTLSIQLTAGKVEMHNAAGYFNQDSNVLTVTIDAFRPTPVLAATTASPDGIVKSESPFSVTVTFDEPIRASTLILSDFATTNASVVSVSELGASGDTFSIGVAPDADGGINVQLPEAMTEDLVGNPNMASNILTVIYETPPTTIPPTQGAGPPDSGGGDGPPDGGNGGPGSGDSGNGDPGNGGPGNGGPGDCYCPNCPDPPPCVCEDALDNMLPYYACKDSQHMKTISLSETTFVTVLEGSTNDDTLRGNSKDNTLIGGDGDDSLAGRGGRDQLIGGRGSDTFVITDEPCDVTILDFETGASHDQLNLRIFPSITSMEALEQRMTSGSVIIDIDDMHRVTIANLIQEEVFDPRYFLLSEGADEARDKGDDECGWFAYSRPECVDTILSIVLGIVGVAGLGVGVWQFAHNFLKRGQKPTEEKPTENEEGMDHRKRSISDTRDSRKKSYLQSKSERRVSGSNQEEKQSGDEVAAVNRV